MPSRRTFIINTSILAAGMSLPGLASYPIKPYLMESLKISLAQWSLHRSFENKILKAEEFAEIATGEFGIAAVEYVNSFYKEKGSDEAFWREMNRRSENAGVKNLLIMVDGEGELGSHDAFMRKKAVENHYKWIHAIKLLGGHAIRVNAFGTGDRSALMNSLTDGLGRLSEYAGSEGIQVLIENHGLHTSDAGFMIEVIKNVGSPYLGTLPDFGNWCLSTEWGSTQGQCENTYDPKKGVAEFLPLAGGVSAKSYDFDAQGRETTIDYPELLKLVRDLGYIGYIGIEYEGHRLSEPEGIEATKLHLEKVWNGLG